MLVKIKKINEVYLQIDADDNVINELNDYFSFDVPSAKFSPAFRKKHWDGKIRLFSKIKKTLYVGLLEYVEKFCSDNQYQIKYQSDFNDTEFSVKEAVDFIKTLDLPFEPRDYQMEAFIDVVRKSRRLLLSPTASGKSLILYMLYRYYNKKTLLIVPTVGLIHQMYNDFVSYGYNEPDNILKIFSGQEKQGDQQLYISTWQSIYELPKKWFDQFDVVLGDEAHGFQAKSLTTIMTNLVDCKYRIGVTGTIKESQTHKLVLEGLFGPVKTVTTYKELFDNKHIAEFDIKCIVLNYPDQYRKLVHSMDYPDEIDYIVRLQKRNNFISNLAHSLNGNTLVLFHFVDKHGKVLYDMIRNANPDKKVFFIAGEVEGEERDRISKLIENEDNAILVASKLTTAVGVNIVKLKNIIFTSPAKDRIKTLQAIGRVLRKSDIKTNATLFDIADDFNWNDEANYTLDHFIKRIQIYNQEKFKYKIYKVSMKL